MLAREGMGAQKTLSVPCSARPAMERTDIYLLRPGLSFSTIDKRSFQLHSYVPNSKSRWYTRSSWSSLYNKIFQLTLGKEKPSSTRKYIKLHICVIHGYYSAIGVGGRNEFFCNKMNITVNHYVSWNKPASKDKYQSMWDWYIEV